MVNLGTPLPDFLDLLLVTWIFPGLTDLALTQLIPIPIVHLHFPQFKLCRGALVWAAEFLPTPLCGCQVPALLCVTHPHALPHCPTPSLTHKHSFSCMASAFPDVSYFGMQLLIVRCLSGSWDYDVSQYGFIFSYSAWSNFQCSVLSRLVLSKVIFDFSNNLCPKLVLVSSRQAAQSVHENGNRSPGQSCI